MTDSIEALSNKANELIMKMRNSQVHEKMTVKEYLNSRTKEELVQLMAESLIILDKLAKRQL